jgi:hypothetical protein
MFDVRSKYEAPVIVAPGYWQGDAPKVIVTSYALPLACGLIVPLNVHPLFPVPVMSPLAFMSNVTASELLTLSDAPTYLPTIVEILGVSS